MDDISDIQREDFMKKHNITSEEMEKIEWSSIYPKERVESVSTMTPNPKEIEQMMLGADECKVTKRSICINCTGLTMGLCERGIKICKDKDYGSFIATLLMIVFLCLLFWVILYKFIF